MAERFTLAPDGTAVPYVPERHDPPATQGCPKCLFATGDKVQLTGIVTEIVHLQGPHFNVRVQVDNHTLWMQQEHLKAAQVAAYRTSDEKPSEEEAAGKNLKEPPETRAIKGPKETK